MLLHRIPGLLLDPFITISPEEKEQRGKRFPSPQVPLPALWAPTPGSRGKQGASRHEQSWEPRAAKVDRKLVRAEEQRDWDLFCGLGITDIVSRHRASYKFYLFLLCNK